MQITQFHPIIDIDFPTDSQWELMDLENDMNNYFVSEFLKYNSNLKDKKEVDFFLSGVILPQYVNISTKREGIKKYFYKESLTDFYDGINPDLANFSKELKLELDAKINYKN